MTDIRDLIEQEARDTEENPDAPIQPGTKVTRPGQARSEVFPIRFNPDELAAIKQAAEAAGVPAGVLARGWILQALAAHQDDSSPVALVEQLAQGIEQLRVRMSA